MLDRLYNATAHNAEWEKKQNKKKKDKCFPVSNWKVYTQKTYYTVLIDTDTF